jgi:hypothetical protein
MIAKLLELLGLSAGQAGIGVMLIVAAVWARRAIIAGELLATGIRFGSVIAAIVGLGIVAGVISIDLSVLFAGVGQLLEFVRVPFDVGIGSIKALLKTVVSNATVLLLVSRVGAGATAWAPARECGCQRERDQ